VAEHDRRQPTFDDEFEIEGSFPQPTIADWREAARRSLDGRDPESLTATTHEGIAVKPLYTADDLPAEPVLSGPARREPWTAACPIDLRDPMGTIARVVEAVDLGARAFWFWVDRRSSSWGRLTAGTFALLREAAGGAPIYLDGRAAAPALAALMAASTRREGHDLASLEGSFDFDPVGALVTDGALPSGLEHSLDLMAETLDWCEQHGSRMRAVAVSTLPYAKAGATAVQELALSLATATAYLRGMEKRGLQPEVVCRRLRFVTAVGRDLFMEVAKLRAVRALWARVADSCGVSGNDRYPPIHAITSPRCLSVRDPWVNLLRCTVETYAAVVGGADVVTVLPFDSAIGRSDAFSSRLSVNTNTILNEESHIGEVRDPVAGSYFIEKLTHEVAAAAWAEFQRIELAGGVITHLGSGALARELAEVLDAKRRAVSTLRELITGVNSFAKLDEEPLVRPREQRDPRRSPDDEATAVYRAVGAERGTFVAALQAANGGAPATEIVDLLRGDEETERVAPVATEREARPFERLRDSSDRYRSARGARPHVFLAAVGGVTENRAAATFVTNLLASGGVPVMSSEDLDDAETAATAFVASGCHSAVICAPPKLAPELVPILARELRARGARRVLVACDPGTHTAEWRQAGVDIFVRRGMDAIALIEDLLEVEGVPGG
jgi:methylmalonyl-CoA mutase